MRAGMTLSRPPRLRRSSVRAWGSQIVLVEVVWVLDAVFELRLGTFDRELAKLQDAERV